MGLPRTHNLTVLRSNPLRTLRPVCQIMHLFLNTIMATLVWESSWQMVDLVGALASKLEQHPNMCERA